MLSLEICERCEKECDDPTTVICLGNPRVNLGSGKMIKKGYINFDFGKHQIKYKDEILTTDMQGRIEDMVSIFGEDTLAEILCVHVIEHFRPQEGLQVIKDCYTTLRPGGILIMEGPDMLGMYDYYITRLNNVDQFIAGTYGNEENVGKFGDHWVHKWGYTRETLAEVFKVVGFKVRHVGGGLTHGMGARDFRVEGVK